MANLSTLSDSFSGTTLDTSKWNSASITVSGGYAVIPGDSSGLTTGTTLRSVSGTNYTFDSFYAKLAKPSGGNFYVRVESAHSSFQNRGIMFYTTNGGNLTAAEFNSGSIYGAASVTYNASTMAYVRFVVSSPNVLAQYSADGASWTTLNTWSISSLDSDIQFSSWSGSLAFPRIYAETAAVSVDAVNFVPTPTTVTGVVATSSSNAVAPSVKFYISAPVATSTSNAATPTPKITLDTPSSASLAAFPIPDVLTPVNVLITAIVASSTAAAVVPTDVIAPAPNTIAALPAFVTAAFPAPVVQEAPNTLVYAPRAAASIEMLPPGEQVRVSVPVLTVSAMTVSPRRVGPALSIYASTVVQTEQNFGGAFAYYRLSDETSTLTDEVSGRHGGWTGTKSLVGGALSDDPDTAVYFNGNDTKAQVGVIPPLNVEAEDPAGLPGNVDPYSNEPYRTGAGVGFWFYCPEGMTSDRYLLSFSITGSATDTPLTVRVSGGQLVARIRISNSNWVELASGTAVNDGQWHFGFVTTGRVLGDESPSGAGTNRLYVDGVLANSNTLNSISWYGDFILGALTSTSTTGLWEGGMDEVALYDYAPSRWEVLEQWNQGKQLSGPPLRFDTPPNGVVAAFPTVSLRRSAVRPLNEFYDDFNAPFIDLSKWRDASDTASIVNGALSLSANGERVLTQDYFQAKDSSLIVRVDKLPLFQGELFIGLTNENDTVPDWQYGGLNQFDTFRRHRDIGFKITRSQLRGQTVTVVQFVASGLSFEGTNSRVGTLAYIPDDPNFPSPMKWLRLDIDPGRHGGATWYTGSDGVNWTERYDVHGGKVNALVTEEVGPNGNLVKKTQFIYEDVNDFYLFDRDELYPDETEWRGYMRVLIQASGGSAATDARVDNLNVLPVGVGNPVDMLAKPAVVQTGSYNEYLIYALSPRLYSSASDIQVAAVPARASVGFPTPPSPVYVFALPGQASAVFRDLLRAGDAVPVAIPSDAATAAGSMKVPAAAGQATDKVVQPNQAQAYVNAIPALVINTDQSSPAPVVTLTKRTITITRRPTRVLVTQN